MSGSEGSDRRVTEPKPIEATRTDGGSHRAERIPRVIWMFWLQGWEEAPPIIKACRSSWETFNPDWTLRALSGADISDYLDLADLYPGTDLNVLTRPALSDLIRLGMLEKYGGLWVDATVFCNRPLASWLDSATETGFFAFSWPSRDRMVATWLLAAAPHHDVVTTWKELAAEFWRGRDKAGCYFWVHRLFGDAYGSREDFRESWDRVPKLSARPPNYFVPCEKYLIRNSNRRVKARIHSGRNRVFKLTKAQEIDASRIGPRSNYALLCALASTTARTTPKFSKPLLLVDRVVERARWSYEDSKELLKSWGVGRGRRRRRSPAPPR